MIIKTGTKKVLNVSPDMDGGVYTIIPFSEYDTLPKDYVLMFENGLGERTTKIVSGSHINELFDIDVMTFMED